MKYVFASLMLLASASTAYAEKWVMVGDYDFALEDPTNKKIRQVNGVALAKDGYMIASVNTIPVGSQVTMVYCQVADTDSSYNIRVDFREVFHDDNVGDGGGTNLFYAFNTTGAKGPHKLGSVTPEDPNVPTTIKDFTDVGSGKRYYKYSLHAFLRGKSGLAIRHCAIGYR